MDNNIDNTPLAKFVDVLKDHISDLIFYPFFRETWNAYNQACDNFHDLNAKIRKGSLDTLKEILTRDANYDLALFSMFSYGMSGLILRHTKTSFDALHLLDGFEEYIRSEIVNEEVLKRVFNKRAGEDYLSSVLTSYKPSLIKVTPVILQSKKEIDSQYLSWLKKHPNVLDKIAWEAFEKMVAEILASYGFKIDITARLRNKSADIIAIRTDELGIDTKYLIECKRFKMDRPIGLNIVNSVVGAAKRAKVEHAILVTTSRFTKDVRQLEPELSDLRLHLKDGDDVIQWLKDYKPREDGGLYLAPGWDL